MADANDNACDYDMEMGAADIDLSVEIKNLMQKFGVQTLKMLELQNRRIGSAVARDEQTYKNLIEKMSLLCGLNRPQIDPNKTTIGQIDKIHGEILQQFKKLFDSEDDYMRAYDQHCKAIKKNKKISKVGSQVGYDEFTTMPHAALEDCIAQLQRQHLQLKKSSKAMREKRIVKQKEYEAKYNAIIKEFEQLEKYDLEGDTRVAEI
ncbi:uncharacterized protein LOC133848921 isoform X2 [Drosophila sulfurigaster albostrigata]|uniref:uncharacterized protein LOC133848921 isoform X2 n=1 Tax=Drosophila sulfurigaster albostrigata TaxID=89887 RepID=UPI002D21B353|nr:uncharacterized protein LOC133848921 isoform X2 [Drosophila sulfurigaster albostrigata]